MNPLDYANQTSELFVDFTIVLVIVYVVAPNAPANQDWYGMLLRWLHFLAGITWIGLLYFLNLVNAGFMKSLDGPTKNIVIPKLIPSALAWFRHGSRVTLLAGILF